MIDKYNIDEDLNEIGKEIDEELKEAEKLNIEADIILERARRLFA